MDWRISDEDLDPVVKEAERVIAAQWESDLKPIERYALDLRDARAEIERLTKPSPPELMKQFGELVMTEEGRALIRWHEVTEDKLREARERIAELEAERDQARNRLSILKSFAAFAASCIKCGESWSDEAQRLFDAAMAREEKPE